MKKSSLRKELVFIILIVFAVFFAMFISLYNAITTQLKTNAIEYNLEEKTKVSQVLSESLCRYEITADVYYELIDDVFLSDDELMMLSDNKGNILFSQTNNSVLPESKRILFDISQKLLNRNDFKSNMDIYENKLICATRTFTVGENSYCVICAVTRDYAVSGVDDLATVMGFIFIIIFIVLFVLAYVGTMQVTKPLFTMVEEFDSVIDFGKLIKKDGVDNTGLSKMIKKISSAYKSMAATDHQRDLVWSKISDAVIVTDLEGNVTLKNPSADRLGVMTSTTDQMDITSYSINNEAIIELLTEVLETKEINETQIKLGDIPYRVKITPYKDDSEYVGTVIHIKDITEYEKIAELRDRFVSSVSHELRTPLTIIGGHAQNIAGDVNERISRAEVNDLCNIISNEVDRLSRLIKTMQTISKLRAGELKMNEEPLNITYCIGQYRKFITPLCENNNITLKITMPDEDVLAMADYDSFRQILVILSDNAVKFTPKDGSGVLHLLVTNCEGTLRRLSGRGYHLSNPDFVTDDFKNRVVICLKDNGKIIPYEEQLRIFERFYTSDKAHSSMGLGLSLASEMVASVGNTMIVTSNEDDGTVLGFTLRIPTQEELEEY